MKKCNGCVYENDQNTIITGGIIYWCASLPHPCEDCERSNYQNKDHYQPVGEEKCE